MSLDRTDIRVNTLLIDLNKQPGLEEKPAFLLHDKDFEGIETEKELLIEPL